MKTERPIAANAAVVYSNHIQFAPGGRVDIFRVRSRMLLWCSEGKGMVRVNGKSHPLTREQFLIIPWEHSIRYDADLKNPFHLAGIHIIPDYDTSGPLEYSVEHLSRRNVDHPCDTRRSDAEVPCLNKTIPGSFADCPALKNLAEYTLGQIYEPEVRETENRLAGRLLLCEFIAFSKKRNLPLKGVSSRLRQITRFAESHLSEKMSVDLLAHVGECSRTTVTRLFREYHGRSAMEWLHCRRMERAAELLRTTILPIGKVAERVGIENKHYFSKLFRKQFNLTATQYRKNTAWL